MAPNQVREQTRDERICSYMRMAKYMSQDVGHWSLDSNDLTQEAMVAIVKAVDDWDPSKAPLTQHVQYRIRCALKNAIRKAVRANALPRDDDVDVSTLLSTN